MDVATTTSNTAATGSVVLLVIIWLAVSILMIASLWVIFRKAGKPGWGSLIPLYNTYLMLKIAGKPGWWVILFFIPLVNFVIGIIMMVEMARNFGKGGGFAIGMIILPIIFFPLLAFGDARYIGESAPALAPPPAQ
jgi:ABC-type sulfate transport system permease subunit